MPKPSPEYDPELVSAAVHAVQDGASLRDVAAQAGVSHMTVRRWVAQAGAKPRMGRPTKPKTPTEPPAEIDPIALAAESGRDPLDVAREAHARIDAVAQRELAIGNTKLYSDLVRQQSLLLTSIRQLEESRKVEGGNVVTFTPDQLAAGEAIIRERLALYAADLSRTGGLVCADCGARLRLELASGVQGSGA